MSSEPTRRTVLYAGIGLFAVWALTNMQRVAADDDSLIRVVLVSIFAALILLRPKPDKEKNPDLSISRLPFLNNPHFSLAMGIGGALLSLVGTIFVVHQFEWLGIILLLYACLRWSLDLKYRRDVLIAVFLLYWMHPIPGQVFGRFQLWMQQISVQGAEGLLYALNVPVWAQGFYLRTGLLTVGIPEACSGMRTAVTVSLCTFGVGLLFRLRWFENLVLLAAGVAQVLAFNILRIAAVVILAPRMPREWAETVLHDTLGVFLLVTILIVQVEVSAYKVFRDKRRRIKEGIRDGELEKPDRGRALPGAWRLFVMVWKPLLMLGVLSLGVAYLVYKQRSPHRLNMMRPVIDALLETEVEAASAAIREALVLAPGDRDLLKKRAHVLLVKQDYVRALEVIDSIPPPLDILESMMRGRALMSLGRVDEAFSVVGDASQQAGEAPGAAILMAEFAAVKDIPEQVNRSIVLAARSHLIQDRVRALFPYLALREQWETIVECDNSSVPYSDIGPALVAVQAHLHMRNVARSAEIMKEIILSDPDDPRFLSSLFSLAMSEPGGRWEEMFAHNLTQNLGRLNADRLASYIDYAFRLSRPDLAWLAWLSLRELDSGDPALHLSLARFNGMWFMFRKHALSVEAESASQRIDLRRFYQATSDLKPFKALWDHVPEGAAVAGSRGTEGRTRYLERFFAEIDKRAAAGTLNERMDLSVAPALGLAGKYKEAHAKLREMEERYPEKKREILYQRAVFQNQQSRWQALYETMVAYRALPNYQPRLGADLMFINAMMNLNMGVAALHTAEEARRIYPGSRRVHAALAAIWDVFRYKDQSLFILEKAGDPDPRVVAQLYYDTGRTREAERISNAMSVGIVRNERGEQQRLTLPRAQLIMAKRWPPPLDAAGFSAEAAEYTAELDKATSPYIIALRTLSRDWCLAEGKGSVSDVATWAAIGRNELEKAGALHHLTMLLARQERYAEAAKAIEAGLELMPDSVVLRRIHMVVAEDRAAAVAAAREHCPDDPDIWLASLMVRLISDGRGEWAGAEIKAAVVDRRFSPETFTRAGDFLLDSGMPVAAAAAARHAIQVSQGLLPPYVLGIRGGLVLKEYEWALSCALTGAELAREPDIFYRAVVMLKWARNSRDADVVKALQYLSEQNPEEQQWAERLGLVYFEKRDTRRALSVLSPVIDKNRPKVRIQSLLMAAEAARIEGNHVRAVEILESAYGMYPDSINILNNLIYTLLEDTATVSRAQELLPLLLEMGQDSFPVLDTAAMVYLRAGRVDRAREYMDRALSLVEPGHYAALEVTLNAAEIYLLTGDLEKAESQLEAVWEYPERPASTDRRAKVIQQKLKDRRGQ